jgi:hypothetical protein
VLISAVNTIVMQMEEDGRAAEERAAEESKRREAAEVCVLPRLYPPHRTPTHTATH